MGHESNKVKSFFLPSLPSSFLCSFLFLSSLSTKLAKQYTFVSFFDWRRHALLLLNLNVIYTPIHSGGLPQCSWLSFIKRTVSIGCIVEHWDLFLTQTSQHHLKVWGFIQTKIYWQCVWEDLILVHFNYEVFFLNCCKLIKNVDTLVFFLLMKRIKH